MNKSRCQYTGLKFGHNAWRRQGGGYGKLPYIVLYRRYIVGRDSIPAGLAAERFMTESQAGYVSGSSQKLTGVAAKRLIRSTAR